MWLEKITPKNLRETNPLIRGNILDIQKTAKHPLIIIMWASWVGKDTIINWLLENNTNLNRAKRATTREQKERDLDWDFEYMSAEEMEEKIQTWEVLFSYSSHRNDWSQYWMLSKELKKLKDQPLITVMWQGGLDITNHVPVIVCMLTRSEKDIVDALSGRINDAQTQKNIQATNKSLLKFLDSPLQSQLIIENETNNVEKTISDIEAAVSCFEKGIYSDQQDILNSIFNSNVIDYIAWEHFDTKIFRETLSTYLRDDDWEKDKSKAAHLVEFMYTRKFGKMSYYASFIRNYRKTKNKKEIINEREVFYKETAQVLYNEWFPEEAKKVLLQIWEITEPHKNEGDIEKDFDKISISDLLSKLWGRYTDSIMQWDNKILFFHNWYAWWKNASKLAKETLHWLQKTKGIKIEKSTSMFWLFKIKLLEPYNWIEEIEIEIIKDKV